MTSYSLLYRKILDAFTVLTMRKRFRETFLDCGAFGILNKNFAREMLTTSYKQSYRHFIEQFGSCFDWIASLDFPCEPTALFDLSIEKRVEKTVQEGVSHLEFLEELGLRGKAVNVIQGFQPEDYLRCIDLHKEAGSLTKLMGVGTLCVEKTHKRALSVLRTVRKALPDWVKLHAFGLSMSFLLEARPLIDSTDSHAWATGLEVWGRLKGKLPRQRRVIPRWGWGEAEREEAIWYAQKLRELLAQSVLI